ncbi:ECF transporter S component [Oscillospiraceae bacterium LTW-04]|nr:ECF transporter S component [Oscillospiraceae bacterium MB24-C1]
MNRSSNAIYRIAAIGVLTAMVFAANFLSIPIGDITRIHFGNVFCVLSGLLLGPIPGGLCAGLGGFFYDLFNPLYAAEAPITFAMKFVLGALVGVIAHSGKSYGKNRTKNIVGAVVGSLGYVVVYLFKNFIYEYYLIRNPIETVMTKLAIKGASSIVNGMTAVIVALILLPVFSKAMKASGIHQKLFPAGPENAAQE